MCKDYNKIVIEAKAMITYRSQKYPSLDDVKMIIFFMVL